MTEENLQHLMEIMRTLRSPTGCLWDRELQPQQAANYLLEEAYEVMDAVENGSPAALQEELGDVLLQIIVLACMAEEQGDFTLAVVMKAAGEKMIRRHPHVFGNTKVTNVADINENWQRIKKIEKGASSYGERFAGTAKAFPALVRAQKITKEAARAGFDWEKTEDVLTKVEEEWAELKEAIETGRREKIQEEMGDMLFSLVNLCRFLDVDAESSLRLTLQKFIKRFSFMEEELSKEGKKPTDVPLVELDKLWEEAKQKGDR